MLLEVDENHPLKSKIHQTFYNCIVSRTNARKLLPRARSLWQPLLKIATFSKGMYFKTSKAPYKKKFMSYIANGGCILSSLRPAKQLMLEPR
jgi:hypothetical protein